MAEVADLVEACFAAAALHGVGQDESLAIARDKRRQRGGLDGRLVWMGNLEVAGLLPALVDRDLVMPFVAVAAVRGDRARQGCGLVWPSAAVSSGQCQGGYRS